ncbi:MAG: ribonuclease J [Roseburia sp.]|nr:ribonuclease J [Anaeroplasma bactoclasticum]MCM1196174.1 ribonuclease J [Roseburia sp.]MCM1556262.1 ribonuclease J [Anaeroplasma bactoclasticum]
MAELNIFSLGGLQEDGKNLYVIEINHRLFILDAGLKYPTAELYGVDMIINDISFLVQNKNRVVGIFLTHAHDDHIGGVYNILKEIKVPVYASKFTMAVLLDRLKEEEYPIEQNKFITVNSKSLLHFKDIDIRFFDVAHSIPDCLGIAIKTPDGYIIYTGNYNFDQNSKINYAHMYRELAIFSKEGVLALLTESLGADNDQSRGTILEFNLRIKNILSHSDNRVIFTLFSSDLLRIQQIIDIAVAEQKKVAILGRKTQRLVNQAMQLGYLKCPLKNLANLKFIDEKIKNNDKDLVVLVTGERHEPYFMLQRMAKHVDRLIHLEPTDTVVILTNPYLGTEKMAARTLDVIYRVTTNVKEFKANLLPHSSANREEIKQMINILLPKYIVPVIGEYRHQYALRIIANCLGYSDDRVIILDSGDIATFIDGEYRGITGDIPVGEIMLDGKAFKDVGDVVMRDRELLAEDGLLMLCANINPRTKSLVAGPEIITKGFVYTNVEGDLNTDIIEVFKKVSIQFLVNKFINWSEYKNSLKTELQHFIYKKTKRNPIIIPVLISTDIENSKKVTK